MGFVLRFVKVYVALEEVVDGSACLVQKHRLGSIIKLTGFLGHPVHVIVIGAFMVLISLSNTEGLSASVVEHELLQTVRQPDVEETDCGHYCEPVCCVVNIACPIVSVECKHASHCNSPLERPIS